MFGEESLFDSSSERDFWGQRVSGVTGDSEDIGSAGQVREERRKSR